VISFLHPWDARAASYRYRAQIPAKVIGATVNDPTADVLVYAKPQPWDAEEIRAMTGKRIVADVCDDYTRHRWFQNVLKAAQAITCSTVELRRRLESFGFVATHIDDPYECDEAMPHCAGDRILWFGHSLNLYSLEGKRISRPVRVVSNRPGTIPWSIPTLLKELALADIVIVPETSRFKSPNRTVEAIRRGCFVVAEPHPALNQIPGIWIGDLNDGIEWASTHQQEANEWTKTAQEYCSEIHSPARCGEAWKRICEDAVAYV
jgi:hypothetical protein